MIFSPWMRHARYKSTLARVRYRKKADWNICRRLLDGSRRLLRDRDAERSHAASSAALQNSCHSAGARFMHASQYHRQAPLQQPIEPAGWLLRCALRHQRTRETRASRTQCRFGKR